MTSTAGLQILFIGSSWPHDHAFGGQLRALHTARALQQIGRVTVTVVGSAADRVEAMHHTAEEFAILPPVQTETLPRRTMMENARLVLDPDFLNVHGVAALAAERTRLLSTFGQYDLIWVLNSRTPNLLQRRVWPGAHLDVDDLPSRYLSSVVTNGPCGSRDLKLDLQRLLQIRRERRWRKRFTTLSVCSEADRHYLGGGDQIHVIPNGFEHTPDAPQRPSAGAAPRIGFMGLFTYEPNRDGVRWFLEKCWPQIRRAVPNVRFRLAGKGTETLASSELGEGVDPLGWIDDPVTEIASWSTMIVPIRFGAGTRIKIADGFSRKCPMVATTLGAFGYDVANGREICLADRPEDFAAACIQLVRDPAGAAAMAERAHTAFLEKWTWEAITPRIWAAAEDCLRRTSALGATGQ